MYWFDWLECWTSCYFSLQCGRVCLLGEVHVGFTNFSSLNWQNGLWSIAFRYLNLFCATVHVISSSLNTKTETQFVAFLVLLVISSISVAANILPYVALLVRVSLPINVLWDCLSCYFFFFRINYMFEGQSNKII